MQYPRALFAAFVLFGVGIAAAWANYLHTTCSLQQEPIQAVQNNGGTNQLRADAGNQSPSVSRSSASNTKNATQGETPKAVAGIPFANIFCAARLPDIAIVLLTYCLVVVGAFQAYWMARTVKVSEIAANVAGESAEAVVSQLRAYLSVVHGPNPNISDPAFSVRTTIKNNGQTPAYKVKAWVQLEALDPKVTAFTKAPNEFPGEGSTLPPANEIYTLSAPTPISAEDTASIKSGAKVLYFLVKCDTSMSLKNVDTPDSAINGMGAKGWGMAIGHSAKRVMNPHRAPACRSQNRPPALLCREVPNRRN